MDQRQHYYGGTQENLNKLDFGIHLSGGVPIDSLFILYDLFFGDSE